MALTPQQIAEKWSRNLGSATQSIREGIEAVTENPAAKAARRQDAYVAGVQRAVAEGKYAAGLNRVTLEMWKEAALTKGLNRIGPGATAAVGKFTQFMTEFMPHVQAGQRALQSLPRGDLGTNIQRAVMMMQHNARFRRRG